MALYNDPALLQAALVGYKAELSRINKAIAELQQLLGKGVGSIAAVTVGPVRKLRNISAEGRAKIAAAQRRRWAAVKRAK